MIRRICLLTVISVFILPCMSYSLPRLAVREFENKTDEPNVPAAAITEMMITELSKAGIFSLIEREKLNYVAEEIRLGQSGLVDPETAPKVGKIKGAQYSMTGAVTLYYYSIKGGGGFVKIIGGVAGAKTAYVTLDIRIIDNATSEVVYSHSEQGSAKRELKGGAGYYKGFGLGGVNGTYGGILAAAVRDSVIKHVAAIRREMARYDWE